MADATSQLLPPIASGVGAVTVALIGVEPQALFWATVGAGVGVAFAPASSRWRAAAVFVFVALSAALLGTWGSELQFGGSQVARNALAMLTGLFAHPAISAAIKLIESVLSGWANRIGAKQ